MSVSISIYNRIPPNNGGWENYDLGGLSSSKKASVDDTNNLANQGVLIQISSRSSSTSSGTLHQIYNSNGKLLNAVSSISRTTSVPKHIGDEDAYLKDGTAYIWSKKLADSLGVSASWNPSKATVNIGGYEFTPQKVEDGKSYVKVRDVAEKLGFGLEWKNSTSELIITKTTNETKPVTKEILSFNPKALEDSYLENNITYISSKKLAGILGVSHSMDLGNGTVNIGGKNFLVAKSMNGQAYVKAGDVVKALGYGIEWDGGNGTVSITKTTTKSVPEKEQIAKIKPDQSDSYLQNGSIYMWSGKLAQVLRAPVSWNSKTGKVVFNGREFTPEKVVNGKSYVKVREVAETLGYNVDWDNNSGSVIISKTTTKVQQVTDKIATFKPQGIGDSYLENGTTYMSAKNWQIPLEFPIQQETVELK
ncbi:stalk domain-containing protein [Effusibacillus consociatus]|uniref:Stalk domain-containing protein n=1 Tax=Effusibacillus consociatus TaxID=1117041 RepID=A0ABV9Q4E6_9BACL